FDNSIFLKNFIFQ
ncbi:hypothetical protein Zm00014a_040590, partial [Zea mays]